LVVRAAPFALSMKEHELWLTALFNEHLAGLANSILGIFNIRAKDAAHPWENWIVMELLVALIVIVLFAVLRPNLSVEKPGKVQHLFEVLWDFLKNTTGEVGIHHGQRYVSYFGTLFIFILFMNLIGIIPGFEAPTMTPSVPAGLAICTFIYYNTMGFRELGVGKYLAHFVGPIPMLAPLMIPIEIVSHLARPLSLTIRLFANMFAGEQVTVAFLGLTYLVAPAVFMGLHVLVSFLQAYIFTLLTMIYVSIATSHEH
jgi:F-type H+-transporting ATPase subunit a